MPRNKSQISANGDSGYDSYSSSSRRRGQRAQSHSKGAKPKSRRFKLKNAHLHLNHRQREDAQKFGKAANTVSLQKYQYQRLNKLDTSGQEIRLFRVELDASGKPYGTLEHHDLDAAPRYRALSYTWGASQPTYAVNSSAGALTVRSNLFEFLQVYSTRHIGEYIWVDQLCINQDLTAERNHQVQLMGKIYRGASEVIVWIPGGSWEKEVVRSLKGEQEVDFSVVNFFRNPYWDRLWVIQELFLARALKIYHGSSIIEWLEVQAFFRSTSYVRYDVFIPEKVAWLARNISLSSNGSHKQGDINTLETVRYFSRNQCQDPRDKIYGLQGLFKECHRLKVDYTKSVKGVFIDAAEILLTECGSRRNWKSQLSGSQSHYWNGGIFSLEDDREHRPTLNAVLHELRSAMGLVLHGLSASSFGGVGGFFDHLLSQYASAKNFDAAPLHLRHQLKRYIHPRKHPRV